MLELLRNVLSADGYSISQKTWKLCEKIKQFAISSLTGMTWKLIDIGQLNFQSLALRRGLADGRGEQYIAPVDQS
jgi:hypothetical protein